MVVMVANDAYTRAYDLDLLAELRRDKRAGAILRSVPGTTVCPTETT